MGRNEIVPSAAAPPTLTHRSFPPNTSPASNLDVLIVTSEAPPIVSGISRCIERLHHGLVARGVGVEVISAVDIPRLTVGEWRFSSFVAHWPHLMKRLREVDVVNLHGPIPTMSDVFLRLIRTLPQHHRPAVVYTHHSPIEIRGVGPLCTLYNKVHASLAWRSDAIIASSEHYARQYTSRYGPQVRTVPWGVDLPPRSSWPSTDAAGPLRVLFVGQMRPYKGVETLLPAVAGLEGVQLTLVGSGARLQEYHQLARTCRADNARFLGRLSDAELQSEYGRHDVIVLPSVTRAEAFGLVLLEGMASGCVPVASRLPGVDGVAGPTGVLVPPGDVIALRKALAALAADRARLGSLQAASRLRAEQLSWDVCVDAYYDAFVSAAGRRYMSLHGMASERFAALTPPAGASIRRDTDLRSVPDDDIGSPADWLDAAVRG